MTDYTHLASDEIIETTVSSLKNNGINVSVVDTASEAKDKALELIPVGSEIMTMTSATCDAVGTTQILNDSGKYNSLRQKFKTMDRLIQKKEMSQLGATPDYAIGSVQAITPKGEILVASGTGSQLSAYAYGSAHVVLLVSTKKIVTTLDEGLRRIYEYSLPLESERIRQLGQGPSSNVAKTLIINNEHIENRINIIFIKQDLGF